MEEEKLNTEPLDSLGDEVHEEQEKKRRIKYVAIVGVLVVLGGCLLFFDNVLNYFTDGKPKSAGQVDKEGARVSRMTEAQWQEHARNVKGLLENGKVDEALHLLQNILSRHPEIAEAHYLAGTAFLRQGRIQGAYDQFKQAVALRTDYYEAQEKLGEIYLLAGDYQAAKGISAKLAKGGEYLQDGLLLDSEIALAEGDLDRALHKAGAAVMGSKAPSKPKSSAYLADLYLKKGDKSKAEKIIGKLNPATMDAEGLLSLTKYYLGAGMEGKALGLFRQALARYPDSAEVNYNYAQYLFKKEQFRDASIYYKKALVSMPDAQVIAYHLAQCYMATGQRENAKARIEAMAQRNPDSILMLGLKFNYYLLESDRRQTIETLNRMIRVLPYAPRPYTILALLYWQEGRVPQAEANAVRAMKLGEKTVLPHLLIGDIFFSKKKFEPALSYYGRVLEAEPKNIIALLQTGDVYLSLGQPKKAEEQYEKALAIKPSLKSIKTKIAWARAQGGDLEGALAMNKKYFQEMPNNSQAVSAYANTLVAANRLGEAIETVQGAIKKNPADWPLHYLLGDLYIINKDFKNAASSYDNALGLNPSDLNMALNIGARYESNAPKAETEIFYLKLSKNLPNNPLVENQLAWFYIEGMGTPQRAKDLVESLLPERDWPEIRDTIAWYYYKLGKFTEAEYYFREALKLAPDRNESRARLALTLYSSKKSREAATEAQKVISQLAPGPLKSSLQEAMSRQGK